MSGAYGTRRARLALRRVRLRRRPRRAPPVHVSAGDAGRSSSRPPPADRAARGGTRSSRRRQPVRRLRPADGVVGVRTGARDDRGRVDRPRRRGGRRLRRDPVRRPRSRLPRTRCGSRTRPATSVAATRVVISPASSSTCASPRRSGWANVPARRWRSRRAATPPSPRRRSRNGPSGRCACSSPTGRHRPCCRRSKRWVPRSSCANVAMTIRPAIRRCCGSARPSPPVPCRSRCRGRRTRCASTAAARSVGNWPTRSARPADPAVLDRIAVQVGGGALAACVGWGLGPGVRLDTVQAQGCAPLARAWWRAKDAGYTDAQLPGRWAQLMTPWGRGRPVHGNNRDRWPTGSSTTRPTTGSPTSA